MSTFYAKSALKVLELFPWISFWLEVNAFANLSMIIRWIRMSSMYFTQLSVLDAKEDLKSLRTGRTVHHQLRMTQLSVLEDQGGFEILEGGQNRASSVANDPTKCVGRPRRI